MADHTHIEWTDATWNPITGCSVVSPGCANCYAMRLAGGRLAHHPSRAGLTQPSKAGPVWTGEVRLNPQWLDQPLRWTTPRRIFVCAHGDLFHEDVPDEWIDQVFARMALTPWHIHQVLTKRSARMRAYIDNAFDRIVMVMIALVDAGWPTVRDSCARHGLPYQQPTSAWDWWPLRNVWLGVSAEDQPRANDRVRDLLKTLAAVRWISAEPLLGGIDIFEAGVKINGKLNPATGERAYIDWIVAGGESGPGARPMHPEWARRIRDDCAMAGVAFFFKQWGAWAPGTTALGDPAGRTPTMMLEVPSGDWDGCMWRVGKAIAGRALDGRTHDAMPEAAS